MLFNRTFNVLIIVLVMLAVGIESYIYWHTRLRPWQSTSPVNRLIAYYSFFTVLSNILLAISSVFLLRNAQYNSSLFKVIRLSGIVGVVITAMVYNVVLRQIHQPPTQILQWTNECLHVTIPLLGAVGWLCYGPYGRIDGKSILLSFMLFLVYGIYLFIRGYLTGQYPYPFINIARFGYEKVAINAAIMSSLFIGVTLILWFIDRMQVRFRRTIDC